MDVLGRGLWLALALGGVLLAAHWLDWAAARGANRTEAGKSGGGARLRFLNPVLNLFAHGQFGILAVAELKLVLRERRLWWWLAALTALCLQAFGTGQASQIGLLLAWILPLDILSRGILREKEYGTASLMFVAPNIVGRLLAVRFAVGWTLLMSLSAAGLVRLFATSPLTALAALTAIVSIASWGLALGALCRNARPFELLLIGAVYVGVQGGAPLSLADPAWVALWHGVLLLPAWLLLAWAWPRLARA